MDEKTLKIGLGTVQFGTQYGISNRSGKTPAGEVSKVLKLARQNSITLIDTASAYGDSEKILGQNDLSAFRIVSKFLPPVENQTVSVQLKQSLRDLHVESLYGYLAHRPIHLADNLSIWEELKSFKKKGLVEKIGFSLNTPEELKNLLQKNLFPDLVQVPFNYFDRRFKDLMIELKKKDCEIHTRSAFLQGLFFMDIEQLDSYFADLIPMLEKLKNNIPNLAGSLLNFVLKKPFIDNVVIGVENSDQLSQNLKSIGNASSLPELEMNIPESILIPSNWP